jgi:hypothetical protein
MRIWCRPRITNPRFGSASPVPRITIGCTGLRVLSASSKAPDLKSRIRPVGERVPSGNIMIELPRASTFSHASIIWSTLSLSPRLSLMYPLRDMFQPMNGIRKFSILDTHLK